jgi:hypothetical protein
MADTLGSLIDKLFTCDAKMWTNQESLYEIRRMTFDDFIGTYGTQEGMLRLFNILKKACDLNVQRSQLVLEIDLKVVEIAKAAAAGEDLDDGVTIQRPHKTY